MIQASVAAPQLTRPQSGIQDDELLDPLWRLANDLRSSRVLVVAAHGGDLMCGLIRRGCLAATVLRPGDKPDAHDYDVVFVAQAAALPSSEAVIGLARRALRPSGRLIAGVRDGRAAAALARRLRLNGFSALHTSHMPGLALVCADLRRAS